MAGWMGYSDTVIHVVFCSLPAKKYKKVTGKEIYSDTLESTPMLEKEKFPQDYFPEVRLEYTATPPEHCSSGWSRRKGDLGHEVFILMVGITSLLPCSHVLFLGGSEMCVCSSGLS